MRHRSSRLTAGAQPMGAGRAGGRAKHPGKARGLARDARDESYSLTASRVLRGLVIVAGCVLFVALAVDSPVAASPSAVGMLTVHLALGLWVLLFGPNRDRFDALRIVTVLDLSIFVVSALPEFDLRWNFHAPFEDLLLRSTGYPLACYAAMVAGYLAPGRARARQPPGERAAAPSYGALGLALFGVGLSCYVVLFLGAGGLQRMIGSQTSRALLAENLGVFAWGALFMTPGGALYFAERVRRDRVSSWQHAWPLFAAAALLTLFQSRARAFLPLLTAILIGHYRIRAVRLTRLVPFCAVGFVFALFVGFARKTAVRPLLLVDPAHVLALFWDDFRDLADSFLPESLGRLYYLMLLIDRIPDETGYFWGSSLLSVFAPLLGLVGLEQLAQQMGSILYRFAFPQTPPVMGGLGGGFHPSLFGELRGNGPWYLAVPLMAAAGFGLRRAYEEWVLRGRDVTSIALYATVMPPLLLSYMSSLGTCGFGLLVCLVPIVLIRQFGSLFVVRGDPYGSERSARSTGPRSSVVHRTGSVRSPDRTLR